MNRGTLTTHAQTYTHRPWRVFCFVFSRCVSGPNAMFGREVPRLFVPRPASVRALREREREEASVAVRPASCPKPQARASKDAGCCCGFGNLATRRGGSVLLVIRASPACFWAILCRRRSGPPALSSSLELAKNGSLCCCCCCCCPSNPSYRLPSLLLVSPPLFMAMPTQYLSPGRTRGERPPSKPSRCSSPPLAGPGFRIGRCVRPGDVGPGPRSGSYGTEIVCACVHYMCLCLCLYSRLRARNKPREYWTRLGSAP
ncbi:hypothetical protein LY76DRAFT_410832 [Colletotrichum caudatum]|nr:hypothetical protein LY76DRAFT_410832 [Colletotrichum caudatum]